MKPHPPAKKKPAKSLWKYHRAKDSAASKWVIGNSWVTKFASWRFCVIGLLGERIDDRRELKIEKPAKARAFVEGLLKLEGKLAALPNHRPPASATGPSSRRKPTRAAGQRKGGGK